MVHLLLSLRGTIISSSVLSTHFKYVICIENRLHFRICEECQRLTWKSSYASPSGTRSSCARARKRPRQAHEPRVCKVVTTESDRRVQPSGLIPLTIGPDETPCLPGILKSRRVLIYYFAFGSSNASAGKSRRSRLQKQKTARYLRAVCIIARLYLLTMYLTISNIRIKMSEFMSNSHPWVTEGLGWCLLFRL